MRYEFHITPADAGRRLDRWLQSVLPDAPYAVVRKLLRSKKVRRNDHRAQPDEVLQSGDLVVVHVPSTEAVNAAGGDEAPTGRPYLGPAVEILHRDDDFVFVAKPAGLVCSDDGSDPRALQLWIQEAFAEEIRRGDVRPEPCHRLDRDTTGILGIALTARAHDLFRRAHAGNNVHKTYEVVVWGTPSRPQWTCRSPLLRRERVSAREPRVQAADAGTPGAQEAITHFETLASAGGRSLLRAVPQTGRTHQIRAHCLAGGLPVVHDPRYGTGSDADGDGQMLHARALQLQLPDRRIELEIRWPEQRGHWLRDWSLLVG